MRDAERKKQRPSNAQVLISKVLGTRALFTPTYSLKLSAKAFSRMRIFPCALKSETHISGFQARNKHVDLFANSFKSWKGDLVQIHL